jgi:hypothetical protein
MNGNNSTECTPKPPEKPQIKNQIMCSCVKCTARRENEALSEARETVIAWLLKVCRVVVFIV